MIKPIEEFIKNMKDNSVVTIFNELGSTVRVVLRSPNDANLLSNLKQWKKSELIKTDGFNMILYPYEFPQNDVHYHILSKDNPNKKIVEKFNSELKVEDVLQSNNNIHLEGIDNVSSVL